MENKRTVRLTATKRDLGGIMPFYILRLRHWFTYIFLKHARSIQKDDISDPDLTTRQQITQVEMPIINDRTSPPHELWAVPMSSTFLVRLELRR